ncbi:MAG: DUF5685 family protein [Firmicutes bacterium]|nr:DUF5685 family protein [Bacillota bacterium]
MFGYVTPLVPELKVKEHTFYKAVYCGLCRTMGKKVCASSRLTLSYDFVFLALLRGALCGESYDFESRRCPAHPVKPRAVVKPTPSFEYSARAGALMAYRKLADDKNDERGLGKIAASLLMPAAKHMCRRANLPELDAVLAKKLKELNALEADKCASPDRAAQVFGEMLADVFSYGFESGCAENRIMYECGMHCGRWIYLIDAADDYEKDIKSGSYNPVAEAVKNELGNAPDKYEELPYSLRKRLCQAMTMELRGLEAAALLVDFKDPGIENIIYNIIYMGMTSRQEKIAGVSAAEQSEAAAEGGGTEKSDVRPL